MKTDKIKINGLNFKNRVVVSPMCQYSSRNGCPSDWHYYHLRNLLETGVGSLVVESTSVSSVGRITKKDLCLYNNTPSLDVGRGHNCSSNNTKTASLLVHKNPFF